MVKRFQQSLKSFGSYEILLTWLLAIVIIDKTVYLGKSLRGRSELFCG